MAVEVIQSVGPKELSQQKKLKGETVPTSQEKLQTETKTGGDAVQISSRAQALNQEFQDLKIRASAVSQESLARIETVKERVASGFYFQEDTLDKVADKLLASDMIQSVIQNEKSPNTATTIARDVPDVRSDKIQLARNRRATGVYQQQDVLSITAERVIKDILA